VNLRAIPKEKPEVNLPYRKFISGKRCSVCGKANQSIAHHQPEKGKSTMGGKTSDKRCLPLCNDHHNEYHHSGRETFSRKYPFWQPEVLIRHFNAEWEDLQRGAFFK
jgi:hypothetical protein